VVDSDVWTTTQSQKSPIYPRSNACASFARRIGAVPNAEIDQQELGYQRERKKRKGMRSRKVLRRVGFAPPTAQEPRHYTLKTLKTADRFFLSPTPFHVSHE